MNFQLVGQSRQAESCKSNKIYRFFIFKGLITNEEKRKLLFRITHCLSMR